ncbi:putative two-component system response regulator [Phycicoccus elongatus Lp2]|jgi:DNA-binding NarL/FixJ family response regulator|uniref:Putative two-component system response regulator n=1 Tax=Phycicoccus elongatus Lp2 TaxID=1193181 RepID=N0E2C9_9MICO|nr:response regulator transcription factor [Phycicoccus elongatus]MBK8729802.1 response regulator transcription factor [Tetrasphaera sp.]CCH69936.1 putative two-component system response regulator [Phycicoccus elongatus Lp2]
MAELTDALAPAHTVLVVDDDFLVREAFRSFFGSRTDLVLVGEAVNGKEALTAYEECRPDVVLMDLQMPVMSGIDAIRELTSRRPEACVVALTTFGGLDYILPALRAGAAGYLLKDVGAEGLVEGIAQALAGEMPLSPSVRRALVGSVAAEGIPSSDGGLTPREVEVVRWLAHGLGNGAIAARMFVSEGSVKQYLSHIGAKLGVTSRTQILVRSIQLGVVDVHDLPPVAEDE